MGVRGLLNYLSKREDDFSDSGESLEYSIIFFRIQLASTGIHKIIPACDTTKLLYCLALKHVSCPYSQMSEVKPIVSSKRRGLAPQAGRHPQAGPVAAGFRRRFPAVRDFVQNR